MIYIIGKSRTGFVGTEKEIKFAAFSELFHRIGIALNPNMPYYKAKERIKYGKRNKKHIKTE